MNKLLSYKSNGANLLKRSIAFILSGAIAIPSLVPGNIPERKKNVVYASTESVTYGDVNSDGKISVLDMIALKSYIIENNTKNFSIKAADLDNNRNVSAKDAVELSMYMLGEISVFPSEDNMDTDEDGLCDYIEKVTLKTNYQVKDTDSDGLDDYFEVYLSGTDPLTKDTGNTDVFDDKRDPDKDGLINSDEQKYGTDPLNKDTDGDGIDDKSEINGTGGYKSDPTKEDTDSDGLSDYEELKLKLNPSKSSTDGKTADNTKLISQSITPNNQLLKEINSNSTYQFSVDASVSGYIENSIKIKESSYTNTIDYDGVYGKIIDVKVSDQRILANDSLKLSFKLLETNINNYMVFKYYDNLNMIFPIPTEYDTKNNTLYCLDDTDGTYCLMEKSKWINTITAKPQREYLPSKFQNNLVLFCTDAVLENTSFNSADYIKKISKSIFDLSNNDEDSLSVEVGLFGYSKVLKQNITVSSYDVQGNNYFNSYGELDNFMYEDEFLGFSDYSLMALQAINPSYLNGSSCMTVPMEMALKSSRRNNEEKFDNIFVFSLSANNYDISVRPADDIINEILGLDSLHGSYIISKSASTTSKEYYSSLAEKFRGQLFYYNDTEKNIADSIYNYIKKQTTPISQNISYFNYTSFVDPSWKNAALSGNISSIENIEDNDGDDLYDIEEINWDLYDSEKTYSDYADEGYTKSDKPKKGIEQLYDGKVVKTVGFIPFVSDPMEIDTDGDGISDGEELIIETNPRNSDTDGDSLEDGVECTAWFDPLDPNPDGDTYNDYKEYQNGTDPFSYNLTAEEWAKQFLDGTIKGDIIKDPTVPQLLGQITGSVVPVVGTVSDVRDTIANASYGHWFMAALSVAGIIPVIGDFTKSSSKVGKFITKNIDNTDEIADLIIGLSKKFPDDFAKLIPNSSLDEIAEALKKNNNISHKTYNEIAEIFKKAGKKLYTISDDYPSAKKVFAKENVWLKNDWLERGLDIDELLGNGAESLSGLGRFYPTYDKYDEAKNIATSIKSMDIFRSTYSDEKKFKKALNKYLYSLLNGKNYVNLKDGRKFENIKKELELAVPDVPITDLQKKILDEFIKKNSSEISIVITIIVV